MYRSVAEGESRRLETVADAIAALDEYVDNKDGAAIVLQELEGDRLLVLPYNHRWTGAYRSMLYAKLKAAERGLDRVYPSGAIPTTLLTLTVDPTDDGGRPRPPVDVLETLLENWDRFRKAVDRAIPDEYRTEYIRVIEPHGSGYPHLHLVIFGAALPSLQESVDRLWVDRYGAGGEAAHREAVTVSRGRSAQLQEPASYVMKYLGKTTVREDGSEPTVDGWKAFSALLWATGRRQYSTSQYLSESMSRTVRDGPVEWEMVGVDHELEPGMYGGDVARWYLGKGMSVRLQLRPAPMHRDWVPTQTLEGGATWIKTGDRPPP